MIFARDALSVLSRPDPAASQLGKVPVDGDQDAARVAPCDNPCEAPGLDMDGVIPLRIGNFGPGPEVGTEIAESAHPQSVLRGHWPCGPGPDLRAGGKDGIQIPGQFLNGEDDGIVPARSVKRYVLQKHFPLCEPSHPAVEPAEESTSGSAQDFFLASPESR